MVSENKVKIDLDGEEGVGTLITIWMPLSICSVEQGGENVKSTVG